MDFQFVVPFVWGLVVLAGFYGWGRVVAGLVGFSDGPPDGGLVAGWGMTLALIVGGVFGLFGWVSPTMVIGFSLIGAIIGGAAMIRDGIKLPRIGWLAGLVVIVVVTPLMLRYASVVSYQAMSCNDDDVVYFPLVFKMLQTGTLLEPFSHRRLAGFGGQSFLQTLVVAMGNENHVYLVDRGISVIIVFGLIVGYLRRFRGTGWLDLVTAAVLAVALPLPLLNSASHVTGVVMFLTLFRTLELFGRNVSLRQLALLGAIVAGAASLRAHFLAAAAMTVVAYWVIAALADRCAIGRAAGRAAGWAAGNVMITGLASLVFLAPWMALLQRSSGSILYPLFMGNHRPDFEAYSAPLEAIEHVSFLVDFFTSQGIIIFMLPVLGYLVYRDNRAGLALYIGTIVTSIALVWKFTYSDVENLHRYVAPFLNAAFIATVAGLLGYLRSAAVSVSARWVDRALWAVFLIVLADIAVRDTDKLIDGWGRTLTPPSIAAGYHRMQNAVPEGVAILSVLDQPFLLDFRRNEVLNVDVPGVASPDPGMPFFRGPAALKGYLVELGIRYVAFRDGWSSNGCLYRRDMWQAHLRGADPVLQKHARHYLDLMANLDQLAASQEIIHRADGLIVIALR